MIRRTKPRRRIPAAAALAFATIGCRADVSIESEPAAPAAPAVVSVERLTGIWESPGVYAITDLKSGRRYLVATYGVQGIAKLDGPTPPLTSQPDREAP